MTSNGPDWNLKYDFLISNMRNLLSDPLDVIVSLFCISAMLMLSHANKNCMSAVFMSVLDNLVSLFVCLFFQVDTVVALYIFLNNNNTSPLLFETSKQSKMRLLHISNRSSGCSICIFIPWL